MNKKRILSSVSAAVLCSGLLAAGGAAAQSPTSEIRGGTTVKSSNFQAVGNIGILTKDGNPPQFYVSLSNCAATLIAPDTVITSATCVIYMSREAEGQLLFTKSARTAQSILDKAFKFNNNKNPISTQKDLKEAGIIVRNFTREDVSLHPLTTELIIEQKYHDNLSPTLAIIHLNNPITNIEPIKLAGKEYVRSLKKRDSLLAIGSGITDKALIPGFFHKAKINPISDKQCRERWGASYVHSSLMCVAHKTRTLCDPDAGAPLLSKTESGEFVVVGIAVNAFSSKTAEKFDCSTDDTTLSAVPSRVAAWIKSVTDLDYSIE